MGGFPLEHERTNPHSRLQITSERARFNPVMNVLLAVKPTAGVRTVAAPSQVRKETKGTPARTREASRITTPKHYGNCSGGGTHAGG